MTVSSGLRIQVIIICRVSKVHGYVTADDVIVPYGDEPPPLLGNVL